jgi:hypothetical protein
MRPGGDGDPSGSGNTSCARNDETGLVSVGVTAGPGSVRFRKFSLPLAGGFVGDLTACGGAASASRTFTRMRSFMTVTSANGVPWIIRSRLAAGNSPAGKKI